MKQGTRSQRILWVTQEPPAATGGGALRQAGLLRYLAPRTEVQIVTAGCTTPPEIAALVAGTHEVLVATRMRPVDKAAWMALGLGGITTPELAAARAARRALRPILLDAAPDTVVVLNHPSLAPLVRARADLRYVLELQYAPAAQLAQEAEHATGFRRMRLRRYASTTRRAERALYPRAHRVVVPSEADATTIRATVPTAPVAVVPNAIDPADHRQTPLPDQPVVVFPASFDFAPNQDGASWLVRTVWPEVRRRRPDAVLCLVGRHPDAEVVALGAVPGVEVHADVPDMHVWFERARVIAVPLRFGTGTRLKALEAMAAGRPLVGTSRGLEGLHLVHGEHALIADEPNAFATAILRVLDSEATQMVAAARRLLQAEFTWNVAGERFLAELPDP